jgi:hypothetical protein
LVQLKLLQIRRARKSIEKQHKCRNKSSEMIQKAQIQKKGQQPNLKLDQHQLTKTTDEAIGMKSSKRSNQEPTTVNYRNRGKAKKDKKKKRRQYIKK